MGGEQNGYDKLKKWRQDEVELISLNLLNVGLSVLVFMHHSKTICWLAPNFWILLRVMLEAGINCAKIALLTSR